MSLAPVKRGRIDGDPVGAEMPRGKDCSQRKSARDGASWTPTESRKRDTLMKQFCRLDGPSGNSEAYVNASCWCWCGKLRGGGCGHRKSTRENGRGRRSRLRYQVKRYELRGHRAREEEMRRYWASRQTASSEASASDGRHASFVSVNEMLKDFYGPGRLE